MEILEKKVILRKKREKMENNGRLSVIEKMNKQGNKLWTYHWDNKMRQKSEKKERRRKRNRRSGNYQNYGKNMNFEKIGEIQKNGNNCGFEKNENFTVEDETKFLEKNEDLENYEDDNKMDKKMKRDLRKKRDLEKKIAELKKLEASKEDYTSIDTSKRSPSLVSTLSTCTLKKKIPLRGFELNKIYAKVRKNKKEKLKKIQEKEEKLKKMENEKKLKNEEIMKNREKEEKLKNEEILKLKIQRELEEKKIKEAIKEAEKSILQGDEITLSTQFFENSPRSNDEKKSLN